jgi:hypothetical protein
MEIKYYDKNGLEFTKPVMVFFMEKGVKTIGKFSNITPQGECLIKKKLPGDKFKNYWRKTNAVEIISAPGVDINNNSAPTDEEEEGIKRNLNLVNVNDLYSINQRFDFLEALVRMTCRGTLVSLIITGEGGIGKTYTVMDQVKHLHLIPKENYIIVKGFSTTKGLYETLYYHKDKLIIFDDCDEILINDNARNILKGALDSYDERLVCWVKSVNSLSDIPDEFLFEGRIIFISNLRRDRMHQALLSRSTAIDVSMNLDEKIARMKNILPYIDTHIDMSIKEKALELLDLNKHACSDVNFRTLKKISAIIASNEDSSDDIAKFMLLS